MKKPRRKPHFFKFITVLESKVWACITGAYLFTSILLAIFDQFNPQSYKKKKEAKMMLKNQPNEKTEEQDEYEALTTNRVFTFKESLWFCITSLTPQGISDISDRNPFRVLKSAFFNLFSRRRRGSSQSVR